MRGGDGASGCGVTAGDGWLAAPVPALFMAATVNVYAVPLDNPATVAEVTEPTSCTPPPGDITIRYPVITDPPSEAGAVHETVAEPFSADAVTETGTPGTVRGVTGADAALAPPVPAAFLAATVNVYTVPFDNPETVVDVPVPSDNTWPPGDVTTS